MYAGALLSLKPYDGWRWGMGGEILVLEYKYQFTWRYGGTSWLTSFVSARLSGGSWKKVVKIDIVRNKRVEGKKQRQANGVFVPNQDTCWVRGSSLNETTRIRLWDDGVKWYTFWLMTPRYSPFVQGNHRWTANSTVLQALVIVRLVVFGTWNMWRHQEHHEPFFANETREYKGDDQIPNVQQPLMKCLRTTENGDLIWLLGIRSREQERNNILTASYQIPSQLDFVACTKEEGTAELQRRCLDPLASPNLGKKAHGTKDCYSEDPRVLHLAP